MASATRSPSRAKQPITRHPLFPAVVALWFGAFLGLGSLAIRVTLLESAVVAIGLDLIVPAAGPPLGVTARILLALALALLGGIIGATIGARLARPQEAAPQRRRASLRTEEPAQLRRADAFTAAENRPRRPLSAFDELPEDEQIADPGDHAEPASRRRPLAIAEPGGPDYARSLAPLPGGDEPQLIDDGVFELNDAIAQEESVAEQAPHSQFAATPSADASAANALDLTEALRAPRLSNEVQAEIPAAQTAPAAHNRPFDRAGAPPELAPSEPVHIAEEVAPSVQSSLADRLPTADSTDVDVDEAPEDDRAPVFRPRAAFDPDRGSAAEQLRAASLDTLSHLELIERLALSIQTRREQDEKAAAARQADAAAPETAAVAVEPVIPPPPMRFGFEPKTAPDEDTGWTAPAATAPVAPALPVALRPIGFDLDDAEDDADFHLPASRLGFTGQPAAAPAAEAFAPAGAAERQASQALDEDEASDTEDAEANCSSLLELGRAPLRQPLIRVEEPTPTEEIEPVVVFPGHGARPAFAPLAASAEASSPEAPTQPGLRRFDPPGSSAGAPPISTPGAAPRHDPEETERALRAALATLQRMSGAA